MKGAKELLIATDEDREGESIGWHLIELLKPKVPVKRMVFSEITKAAIQKAVGQTRKLDTDLVEAQETRRILDRFVRLYAISAAVEEDQQRAVRRTRSKRRGCGCSPSGRWNGSRFAAPSIGTSKARLGKQGRRNFAIDSDLTEAAGKSVASAVVTSTNRPDA